MLRRNLDFLALVVVLAGMAAIQKSPRFGDRISSQMIRYQNAVDTQQCEIGRQVFSKIRVFRVE